MNHHPSQNGKYHHNQGEHTSRSNELQVAVTKVREGLSLAPLAALRQDYTDTTMIQCFGDRLGEDGARLLAPALHELLVYSHEYVDTLQNRLPGLNFQRQATEEPVYADENAITTNETQWAQTAHSLIRVHTENDRIGKRHDSVRVSFIDKINNETKVVGGIDFYHSTAPSNPLRPDPEQKDHFFTISLNHTSHHTTGLGIHVTQAAHNAIAMQALPQRPGAPESVDISTAQDTLATITTLLGIARTDLGY